MKLVLRRALPFCLISAIPACSALEGPDWLVGEAPSPDGRLVARLWCEDFCDVPEASTLTISPVTRHVGIERDEFGAREGQVPEGDTVARIFRNKVEEPLELKWSDAATLTIKGRCLTDGNYRPLAEVRVGRATVRIIDGAPAGTCEHPDG